MNIPVIKPGGGTIPRRFPVCDATLEPRLEPRPAEDVRHPKGIEPPGDPGAVGELTLW